MSAELAHLAADAQRRATRDYFGRLQVNAAPISKAGVSVYSDGEIQCHAALGLDPRRRYRLLRDPHELAKAAGTFENVLLLRRHTLKPAEADVAGVVGPGVRFEDPFLVARLLIWDAAAIAGVESGATVQISANYDFKIIIERGRFRGQAFDARMVNLVGRHVALVARGRLGTDCSIVT
jgi:hypothetical protein